MKKTKITHIFGVITGLNGDLNKNVREKVHGLR
jgi:hypothetical protein